MFLSAAVYYRWLSSQERVIPRLDAPQNDFQVDLVDSLEAKICPESGLLMQKYKVGSGFEFYLDRSPLGSVWFDNGEWEALQSRNFHDEIHLIFTSSWQDSIRRDERKKADRDLLEGKLELDLLEQVDAFKNLLDSHAHRDLILAYLQRSADVDG